MWKKEVHELCCLRTFAIFCHHIIAQQYERKHQLQLIHGIKTTRTVIRDFLRYITRHGAHGQSEGIQE